MRTKCCRISKTSNEVGRIDNFRVLSIYLSTSDLLSSVISNTDKHKFSSIYKWITCAIDVINHTDWVTKRDVYPEKMHFCSKIISGKSFFPKNIRGISRKIYQRCYYIGIMLVERQIENTYIVLTYIKNI